MVVMWCMGRGEGRGGRCKGWCRFVYFLAFGEEVVGQFGKGTDRVNGKARD